MKLFICEKPSQAKDIAGVMDISTSRDGYLESGDICVTWGFGHLLEMANPDDYDSAYKKWSFETLPILPDQWRLNIKKSSSKQFNVIKRLLTKTEHVVIATDADREGETIAREVMDACHFTGTIERLWLSGLDPTSIRNALNDLRPDRTTLPLYHAGLGRARSDWLIGMNLTRAYTLLSKQAGGSQVVSVGRVQTPTLNLIVERDLAIDSFVSIPFYDLVIDCDISGRRYKAKWMPERSQGIEIDLNNRCLNQQQANQVLNTTSQQPGEVISFERSKKQEAAPLPYNLSSLQVDASRQFNMDAKLVLETAQALYETHKISTYPRTDCGYLPESQLSDADTIILTLVHSDPGWAKQTSIALLDTSLKSRCWNDKKITAHHGIIPTTHTINIGSLNSNELKLFGLIRQRYLMQFLPTYRYEAITCLTRVDTHTFISRGKQVIDMGWRLLLVNKEADRDDENQTLPESIQQGAAIQVVDAEVKNKATRPSSRYTSGTLIAAMTNIGRTIDNLELRKVLKETSGIGTDATRATIIETLLDRCYIKKSGQFLISTDFGRSLIAIVPDVLKDPGTTALWEQVLDDIANNRSTLDAFLIKQKNFIRQMVEYLQQQQIEMNYEPPAYPCKSCGKAMKRLKSKQGKGYFWSCSGYPECDVTLPDNRGKPGNATTASRVDPSKMIIGNPCPKCSSGKLQLKTFQKGSSKGKPFIGCTAYPKCDAFAWPQTS